MGCFVSFACETVVLNIFFNFFLIAANLFVEIQFILNLMCLQTSVSKRYACAGSGVVNLCDPVKDKAAGEKGQNARQHFFCQLHLSF